MKYEIGDFVSKPVTGVCKIEDIVSLDLTGKKENKLYYLMKSNEKMWEQKYKAAVKSNDPEALISIIKMIYQRKKKRLAQGKKCTTTDARYFQIAENLLYMELGAALGKPKEEVCETIIEYINKSRQEA